MASQFPKLFHQYYAIHETIHAILAETNGVLTKREEIERRVKDAHPDLDMGPDTLAAAVRQAIKRRERDCQLTGLVHAPNARNQTG